MEAGLPFTAKVPMANADEQYSVRLVAGCKKFKLQTRPDPVTHLSADFKLYFLKDGDYFSVSQFIEEDRLNLSVQTLCWVSCPLADQVLEVLQWV